MVLNLRIQRILLPLLLLLVMVVPASAAPAASSDDAGRQVVGASEKPVLDRHYIDFMVPHHQSAIIMAKIALERANHEEIRAMAQMEIETQTAEIKQLKAWRKRWYGSDRTPPITAIPLLPEMPDWEMGMKTMDMTPMIEMLRHAPEPFDLVFIDLMIKHHMDAIEASLIERHHDGRREMYQMARKIAKDQHKSINEMSELRNMWYFNPEAPLCPTADPCPVPFEAAP